jgi:protein CpxP
MRNRVKFLSITVALVVAMASWTMAQTYGSQTAPQGTQAAPQDQSQMNQGQMAGHEMHAKTPQEKLDWMSQQLNLTDDQKAKLQPILQKEDQQIQTIRSNTSLTQVQQHDQIKRVHESFKSQIEAVLTADQRTKLEQLKAQKHEHENANPSSETAPKQ